MLRRLIVNTFVTLAATLPLAAQDAALLPQIIVTGQGEVTAAPDMATLTFGVSHRDSDANVAMTQVSQTMRGLFEKFSELGVQPRDAQTSTLRVDPLWRDRNRSTPADPPVIAGFAARNDVVLRLRNIEIMGDVIALLLEDGANQLGGISFGVRSTGPLLDEARRRAVEDARGRAQLYALAAGVDLGELLQISEPGAAQVPGPQFARAESLAAGAGVPVAGGELTFRARVTLIYAIER